MPDDYLDALGLRAALVSSTVAAPVSKLLTERIIGCAIEVHRELGPGLLEGTYEAAMCIEFRAAGLNYVRQPIFPLSTNKK